MGSLNRWISARAVMRAPTHATRSTLDSIQSGAARFEARDEVIGADLGLSLPDLDPIEAAELAAIYESLAGGGTITYTPPDDSTEIPCRIVSFQRTAVSPQRVQVELSLKYCPGVPLWT